MAMSYLSTIEEWWNMVEDYREALLEIIKCFHPYYNNKHSYQITAPTAEIACEYIRDEIRNKVCEGEPTELFDKYCKEKNPKMSSLLNDAWFGMPESLEVRSYPGFGVLCDLCSESYLLYESEDFCT